MVSANKSPCADVIGELKGNTSCSVYTLGSVVFSAVSIGAVVAPGPANKSP